MESVALQGNRDFHSNHFESIQTLRGIAAIFVILEHIRFLNCGAFGVDIFFCISGFMIMFTTVTNTKHFLGKRLIRILPLYYIMTAGTYLLLLLFPAMFELANEGRSGKKRGYNAKLRKVRTCTARQVPLQASLGSGRRGRAHSLGQHIRKPHETIQPA